MHRDPCSLESDRYVGGKDTRLKCIRQRVGYTDRLVNLGIAIDTGQRSEDCDPRYLGVRRRIEQDGGPENAARSQMDAFNWPPYRFQSVISAILALAICKTGLAVLVLLAIKDRTGMSE